MGQPIRDQSPSSSSSQLSTGIIANNALEALPKGSGLQNSSAPDLGAYGGPGGGELTALARMVLRVSHAMRHRGFG